MGVGVLVPVDPMVFLIIAFVVIVGGACCATLGDGSSEKTKPEVKNHKSRLKVKKSSNITESNLEWKICPDCGHKLIKVQKKCPYCKHNFEK